MLNLIIFIFIKMNFGDERINEVKYNVPAILQNMYEWRQGKGICLHNGRLNDLPQSSGGGPEPIKNNVIKINDTYEYEFEGTDISINDLNNIVSELGINKEDISKLVLDIPNLKTFGLDIEANWQLSASGYTNISYVDISNTSIDTIYGYLYCYLPLEYINLPKTLKRINMDAFLGVLNNSDKYLTVNFNSTIDYVGNLAFSECRLQNFDFSKLNMTTENMGDEDGQFCGWSMFSYSTFKESTIEFPSNITAIPDAAFSSIYNVDTIIMNNVVQIGASSFYNIYNLINVRFNPSITNYTFGEGAFGYNFQSTANPGKIYNLDESLHEAFAAVATTNTNYSFLTD